MCLHIFVNERKSVAISRVNNAFNRELSGSRNVTESLPQNKKTDPLHRSVFFKIQDALYIRTARARSWDKALQHKVDHRVGQNRHDDTDNRVENRVFSSRDLATVTT